MYFKQPTHILLKQIKLNLNVQVVLVLDKNSRI